MADPLSLSRVFNPRPGWYRGDFHAHTTFSDGALSPRDLAEAARAAGLDFFAVTDHNSAGSFTEFGAEPGVLVIPGIEVTLQHGHFNIFGMEGCRDWMENICTGAKRTRLGGSYGTPTAVMRQAAREGLLNSINHPLLKPWEWRDGATDLRYVDCIEIWNDPSWPDNALANPQAITLWTDLLNAGYRITAIGGSDYHRPAPGPGEQKPPERPGVPGTYVYARELSGAAILAGLRQRRAWVSMGPRAAFQARVNGGRYDMGADLGELDGEIELAAAISDAPDAARAQIVKNGAVIAAASVDGGQASFQCRDNANPDRPAWYRLDVRDGNGLMVAISNPIFIGPRKQPEHHRYGDFVNVKGR